MLGSLKNQAVLNVFVVVFCVLKTDSLDKCGFVSFWSEL